MDMNKNWVRDIQNFCGIGLAKKKKRQNLKMLEKCAFLVSFSLLLWVKADRNYCNLCKPAKALKEIKRNG